MPGKHIFVATHPRACSTAFERVFMTRTETLQCVHEPFGDAFYYGPERLSARFEADEQERADSGFSASTYATVIDRFEEEAKSVQGKRLFIKDIIHYLFPPEGKSASIAPSLVSYKRGVGTNGLATDGSHNGTNSNGNGTINGDIKGSTGNKTPYPYPTSAEPSNPTVIPHAILDNFHFTFLIRHPRKSIPSYYRCTVPPLSEMTGFHNFMPSEAGYDELRRFFDFVRSSKLIGPRVAGAQDDAEETADKSNGTGSNGINGSAKESGIEICVIDADDLLDNPAGIIKAYCASVGIEYSDEMLVWDREEDHAAAKDAFEKWKGFHEDAIHSSDLKPRRHKARPGTPKMEDHEWESKFGGEAAQTIRETVDANIADYEYLKQFALQV